MLVPQDSKHGQGTRTRLLGAQHIYLVFGRAGDYVGVGDCHVRIQKSYGLDGQGEGVTGNGYGEGFFDFGAAPAGRAEGSEVAVFGVAEGFGVGVAVDWGLRCRRLGAGGSRLHRRGVSIRLGRRWRRRRTAGLIYVSLGLTVSRGFGLSCYWATVTVITLDLTSVLLCSSYLCA